MKSIKILALTAILVVSLSLGSACELPDVAESAPVLSENGSNPDDSYSEVLATDSNSPVLDSIADVVAAVKSSVVAIDTEVTYNMYRRTFTEAGAGSGWIIDDSGVIVTNYHVIEGATAIRVTLDDGRTFSVDPVMVAGDSLNDLAVLHIGAENLPALKIGDTDVLRVGDWVVSIGNPLGMGISAKEGIVSRLGVSLTVEGKALDRFIETSAATNPGNSGGPLVDMRGEVVGITSAKISSIGIEGLGYAISINDAIPAIRELVAGM
ncbi:S1C family serine protease [Chloroflexota bacterium]